MVSQKVVIPAQAGIQDVYKALKKLDSRFHGNDGEANGKIFKDHHLCFPNNKKFLQAIMGIRVWSTRADPN